MTPPLPPPSLKGAGRTAVAPLPPAVVALGGEGAGLLARFGRTVGLEAALAVAVLCCAAGLTLLPPP